MAMPKRESSKVRSLDLLYKELERQIAKVKRVRGEHAAAFAAVDAATEAQDKIEDQIKDIVRERYRGKPSGSYAEHNGANFSVSVMASWERAIDVDGLLDSAPELRDVDGLIRTEVDRKVLDKLIAAEEIDRKLVDKYVTKTPRTPAVSIRPVEAK